MSVVGLLVALPCLIVLALAVWLLAEAALGAKDTAQGSVPSRRGTLAVLIPAHDEAAVIGATLASVSAQLRDGDRMLVVADNCSDETAKIARAAGAEVTERRHETDRGKGFALQHGLEALRSAPPETVVIVDADCLLSEGALETLSSAAEASGRPVQALYLMTDGERPAGGVGGFAWRFINQTRMQGLMRMAGVTRLLGTGMAFPWALAKELRLGTAEIVEDIALAAALTEQGDAPRLRPDAVVTSEFPVADEAATTQRARWEIGSLRLARTTALPLLGRSLMRGRWRAAALATDLLVPPLTVFAGLLAVLSVIALVAALFGLFAPLGIMLAADAAFAAAVLVGWTAHGRDALPAAALGGVGRYAASKLRVYGGAGRASAKQWTRTGRD